MSRLISSIFIISLLGKVSHSAGYKWIAVKPGDPLPNDTIILDQSLNTVVGRAQHFNLLLPAEVYNSSYGHVYSCSKEIIKHKFEVLVAASDDCNWKEFDGYDDIPDNIVRAGYDWNLEPIFIGKTFKPGYSYSENYDRVASIYLTTGKYVRWGRQEYSQAYFLICDDHNEWLDTSAVTIPNNTISGGRSEDDRDIFVARLLNDCVIIAGQALAHSGVATAVDLNGNQMQSAFCQVLVGDANDYSWILTGDGEIPDYAVVASKIGKELFYVARIDKQLGYIKYDNLVREYEVLVKNVE